MELNFSPVLTTRNYGINSARVDDSVFCTKVKKFKNFKIENGEDFVIKSATHYTFSCEIGENLDKQLKNHSNLQVCLCVDRSTEKPIYLNFDFDENNKSLVEQIKISVKKNVCADIVVQYTGKTQSYHNGLIFLDCEEGAKVQLIVACDLEEKSSSFLRFESRLEKNSILEESVVDFGSKTDLQRYYSKLVGENAISNLNSLYVAGGDTFLDLNYEQDVFGQKCHANIQTVGALLGDARKHFKGTIYFEKGCKKSVGCEDELCLLLSKNAKSKALPMLLCTEEDVDGKHSSSAGKVGEKELFYLMSRGLSHDEALKMLVKAKFNVSIEKIFDEQLKETLTQIIDRKLSYDED